MYLLLYPLQNTVKRALQKLIVRIPQQSPPPDDITLSAASLKVLKAAHQLQKTMHDSYIAQDHLLLCLIQDSSISAVIKEAGMTEASVKTAIESSRGNRRVERLVFVDVCTNEAIL